MDTQITDLELGRDTLQARYQGIEITNDASLEQASELLGQVRGYLRNVESARLKLTKPLTDHIRELNNRFHEIADPMKALDVKLTCKMSGYRAIVERERMKKQQQLDTLAKENIKTSLIPEAVAPIVAEQPKSVDIPQGKVTFVKLRKFKIADIKLLPLDYLVPDTLKIGKDIKAGKDIPGVETWWEETPQYREVK